MVKYHIVFGRLSLGLILDQKRKKKICFLGIHFLLSSFKFHEYSPFLIFNISNGLSFSSKYSFTQEFATDKGFFAEESKSYAHTYSLNYRELKELNSDLDFSFRKKRIFSIIYSKRFY